MKDYSHPVSLRSIMFKETTLPPDNSKSDCSETFNVENITVVKPPLLKIFYWHSLDIERLNDKLLTENNHIEHHMELPTRQLNDKPLKIILWLRSLCDHTFSMHLKRIRNCECIPRETRVGFNQFRYLYHCPHRRLINISQEEYVIKPNELVAMSIVAYYYVIGTHILSYELSISKSFKMILHFHVNITTFAPIESVLTRKMIPVNIKEYRSMSQPIWIHNITMQNLKFIFSTKNPGFRLINPNLIIPRQSVWPLVVEFMPSDFENNLELLLNFDETNITAKGSAGNHYKISLNCKGFIKNDKVEECNVPLFDYECCDFLYVVYPNKLVFDVEINEEKTLMIAIHNYNQKCMEFRWQPYVINEYFNFTFEPTIFTLKSHHTKLCVVKVKSFAKPLHFIRIPVVLEIHRILDRATQIAKQLLSEVESIDDLKWAEDSYMEHVLLHIDLKVNFPELRKQNLKDLSINSPAAPLFIPMYRQREAKEQQHNVTTTTIFEKLFWEYLSNSNYMRNTSKIPKNLSYEQVLNRETNINTKESNVEIDKLKALNILTYLITEACRGLSKNYRFIPLDC